MPIPVEYRDIVHVLETKTSEGKVNWRREKYDNLAVTVEDSKVSLWAGNDEHTAEPFVAFALHELGGRTIDSWYVDQSDPDYIDILQLYRSANRRALGVSGRLKELETRIAQMQVVGAADDA